VVLGPRRQDKARQDRVNAPRRRRLMELNDCTPLRSFLLLVLGCGVIFPEHCPQGERISTWLTPVQFIASSEAWWLGSSEEPGEGSCQLKHFLCITSRPRVALATSRGFQGGYGSFNNQPACYELDNSLTQLDRRVRYTRGTRHLVSRTSAGRKCPFSGYFVEGFMLTMSTTPTEYATGYCGS
jgi:hypothetical protein